MDVWNDDNILSVLMVAKEFYTPWKHFSLKICLKEMWKCNMKNYTSLWEMWKHNMKKSYHMAIKSMINTEE